MLPATHVPRGFFPMRSWLFRREVRIAVPDAPVEARPTPVIMVRACLFGHHGCDLQRAFLAPWSVRRRRCAASSTIFALQFCMRSVMRHKVCPFVRLQDRFNSEGANRDTVDEAKRGRKYFQALLNELELGDLKDWIAPLCCDLQCATTKAKFKVVFEHLLKKVKDGERWTNLPATSHGGSTRDIATGAPKIIAAALRREVETSTGVSPPEGYFTNFTAFKVAEATLKQKSSASACAMGTEAQQNRQRIMFDHEQAALFESILRNSVAEKQRRSGGKGRPPMDTLTLGVILNLLFDLGNRGINVRATSHRLAPRGLPRHVSGCRTRAPRASSPWRTCRCGPGACSHHWVYVWSGS